MTEPIKGSVLRAVRSAVAIFLSQAIAGNVWYAPIILGVSKAIRTKWPQYAEWVPV